MTFQAVVQGQAALPVRVQDNLTTITESDVVEDSTASPNPQAHAE